MGVYIFYTLATHAADHTEMCGIVDLDGRGALRVIGVDDATVVLTMTCAQVPTGLAEKPLQLLAVSRPLGHGLAHSVDVPATGAAYPRPEGIEMRPAQDAAEPAMVGVEEGPACCG